MSGCFFFDRRIRHAEPIGKATTTKTTNCLLGCTVAPEFAFPPTPIPIDKVSMDDPFRPTWRRGLLAALAATAAFYLPQEVPLEYYPLDHIGDDSLYLQIACASDKAGSVRIWYDTTVGFNEFDSFHWPISATHQSFTYEFPLPDAPIVALQLESVDQGGTLTIKKMRIVDRTGKQIRGFTKEMFVPLYQIAAITPMGNGWNITSTLGASKPETRVDVATPILSNGSNHRNLQRCLLSFVYLGLMLWILLMIPLFVFFRPENFKSALTRMGFMAGLALLFSLVGNRKLIRDSIHYAFFAATAPIEAPLTSAHRAPTGSVATL